MTRCPALSCKACRSATGSRRETQRTQPMTHVTLRSEFEDLIDPYAPVGQIGDGLRLHGRTDLASRGSVSAVFRHARRRAPALGRKRGVVEVRRPSNKCNGMTYDAELNLIVCEHATSSLIRERSGRAARGARLAFREPGTQQPERRLRPFQRRDLLQRSLVWAHAGLWRRAAAAARFPGRLSRSARRRRAETPGRSSSVRPAERAVLFTG